MVDAVLPAPPAIEAFIKGLTELVQVAPAMDLFDGSLTGVEDKKPKDLADVHAATIKLLGNADFAACQRFRNMTVDGLDACFRNGGRICNGPQGYMYDDNEQ